MLVGFVEQRQSSQMKAEQMRFCSVALFCVHQSVLVQVVQLLLKVLQS